MSTVSQAAPVDFRARLGPFVQCPGRRATGPLPYHLSPEMAGLFEHRGALHILDIGCGPAQNRAYFAARRHRYVGLDIAAGGADVRADAVALPFGDQTFDAVITIAALQYTLDPLRFLAEAHRVLRPGGTVTGTVAFLEPWTYAGLVQLSPGGLVGLLQAVGFRVQHIWPGWSVDLAVQDCAYRPVRGLGRLFGRLEHLLHVSWWGGINLARRLAGRPARSRLLQELEFAASINFHAVRPGDAGDGSGGALPVGGVAACAAASP